MTFRFCLFLMTLGAATPTAVLAQNTPRELNTLPTVPDSARRQTRQQPQLSQQPQPPAQPAPSTAPVPASPIPSENSKFAVGLKNGTVYRAYDVETKQPIFGRSYLLLDDQRRIDLSEISFYEDESGHYVRTVLPKSSRETTLRRDRVGRLSLYSQTSTQYAGSGYSPFGYGRYGGYGYGGYGYGGPMYRTVKTEYFSKDNGPIQDLSVRNLSIATADNAGSVALLMQARKYQTFTTLSYIAAAGVVAAGLFSTLNPGQSGSGISPLIYAGIPLAIVPIVLGSKQQQNIKQAISLYNRGSE
ncbi:hypothetical protein [Hymenobacter cellulosilyticus]|uniref:Uncharacterized protein n=1 Tax=Hymenobacter cellulosilyticus TaxID=2932248 RepID=A0A8T9QAX0_9BACT|nr:hypothetical protein [Hymenobacter cellulosilyticus]UOQ74315.1 hypothetical protein MUN79_10775 [Hymenobacter cellulosilyticus]